MEINRVVDAYFAAIRAKDIESLMALYAQNATFILPDGREFSGVDAIRAMHTAVFAAAAFSPTPTRRIVADNAAAIEIEGQLPDGAVMCTTNHYSIDKNAKIERLSVYIKK